MSNIRDNAFRGLVTVVYLNYVEKDLRVVDETETYWVPTAEVFSHRMIKRTRDTTKPKGTPEGRKRWDELYWSMRRNGFDPDQPVIFEIKKGDILRISHGHHRSAVASELGIPMIPVRFVFQ